MVDLEQIIDDEDRILLKALVSEHHQLTDSGIAKRVLADWDKFLPLFVKIVPRDYKRVTKERSLRSESEQQSAMDLILNG